MSRPAFQYVPGGSIALASASVGMLLATPPDHPVVDRLLELLDGDADVDDLLDALVRDGLRSLPDFACAEMTDAGLRLVVRGAFTATPDAGAPLAASRPWSDAVVPATSVVLRGAEEPTGRHMPFRGGIVLASELVLDAALPTARPAAPPPPAPPTPPPPPAPRPTPAAVPPVTDEPPIDFDHLFAGPTPPAPEPAPADPAWTSPAVVTARLELEGVPAAPPVVPGLIQGLPWEQPAAAEPPAPPASDAPPTDEPASRTINRSQLLGQSSGVPSVLAVRCPQGHLNPTFVSVCRVCRAPLPPQQQFEVPRPPLGVLRLSTGAVVTLDRGAVLGRNPRVPADHHGGQPNLVKVVDPERDVSGQHLEVALDFWNVVVRDLGSTNGTEVVLPGAMPVTLRANEPMILEPGSKVVMAGTVSFVFEATE